MNTVDNQYTPITKEGLRKRMLDLPTYDQTERFVWGLIDAAQNEIDRLGKEIEQRDREIAGFKIRERIALLNEALDEAESNWRFWSDYGEEDIEFQGAAKEVDKVKAELAKAQKELSSLNTDKQE